MVEHQKIWTFLTAKCSGTSAEHKYNEIRYASRPTGEKKLISKMELNAL